MGEKIFRCPFETKGIQDKTIIEVELDDTSQEVRFGLMQEAFEDLHRIHRYSAIRLLMPDSILEGCTGLEMLRDRLLPYQAEVAAVDLDDQLFPSLPHQDSGRDMFETLGMSLSMFDEAAANALRRVMGKHPPRTLGALAAWLLQRFQANPESPLVIKKHRALRFQWGEELVKLDPSGVYTRNEVGKYLLYVVKTPFYPYAFGRYSERVEIVLTRHIDAARLPTDVRRRIQRQANEVHAAHGVVIPDLDTTPQPTGLWIPRENVRIVK